MVSTFISTRKENPCSICDNTDGRCRQIDNLQLCMNTVEEFFTPPGWNFLGLTKDHQWGKFVVDNTQQWTEERREQRQREKAARVKKETQRRKAALPAEKRDRQYRRLLNSLPLHLEDRANLHQRGLTDEQIEDWGAKSVEQWQKLPSEFSYALPGVSLNGKSLNTPGAGYLCPIYNVEGRIVAFQIRIRDAVGGNRYRWLSSKTKNHPDGPTAHLPNCENPITVARPLAGTTRQGIGMAEGILKPFVAAQKLEQVVSGAVGGQFASSPKTLKHSLEQLSLELGSKEIHFYADAGSVANRQILEQYRSAWELLQEWGYEIYVAW